MKKLLTLLVLIVLGGLLSGCTWLKDTPLEGIEKWVEKPLTYVTRDHPENQLKDFLSNMENKDYGKAYSFIGKNAKKMLPEENLKNYEIGSGATVQAVEFDKDNKASVYFKYKNISGGQVAQMVKEDGKWKITSVGPDDNNRF